MIKQQAVIVRAWLVAFAISSPCGNAIADESSLVYTGDVGRLLYATQADGDRIMDFSRVGYQYGNAALPTVATSITVPNGAGDDTAAIQSAINLVSGLPLNSDGFRGAVVLDAGEYEVASSLYINASGVVLRGAGDSLATGTTIRGTGTTQRSLIRVNEAGSGFGTLIGPTVNVVDKYVPVGATSFRVDSAGNFAVGDRVRITRPGTTQWISDLGMDMIPPDGGDLNQWEPQRYNLFYERHVTRVEGDRIFFDAPLANELKTEYGGGTIRKLDFDARITNVGIEGIRGVSDFDSAITDSSGNFTDEAHAWTFIQFQHTEHGWARDVTGQHFGFATVLISDASKNITVEDAHSIDPVSRIRGGTRYAFNISQSELNLIRDMTSDDGRHDFVLNSTAEGPNVFLNGVATNANSDSGPHQRWSTGGLFDNIIVQGNRINVRNRGNSGSGHGWAGANMVIWNSQADGFIVQSPQTAQNWLIGSIGSLDTNTSFGVMPDGIVDHHGSRVDTDSLYLKQLADRMAVSNGQTFEYNLGDYDNYFNDGPSSFDTPDVSPSLLAEFGDFFASEGLPLGGFDQAAGNQYIPMTWSYGVSDHEQVFHAAMTLAIKKTGDQTSNDAFWFERLANQTTFSDFGLTAELSDTDSSVIILEFTGSDLAWFNDGEFNFVMGEDVAIDWARLDLYIADLIPGDLNGDGVLTNSDIAPFVMALTDPDEYAATFPDLNPDLFGDFTGDSILTNGDIAGFVEALTGDPSLSLSSLAVPEPGSLALLGLGGLVLVRRRRI